MAYSPDVPGMVSNHFGFLPCERVQLKVRRNMEVEAELVWHPLGKHDEEIQKRESSTNVVLSESGMIAGP